MIRALAAAVFVYLAVPSAYLQDQKPNFTGTWTLDVAKSDFGPTPLPDAMTLVIRHQDPEVSIASSVKNQSTDSTGDVTFTIDAKEHAGKMRVNAVDHDAQLTGMWDGKALVLVSRFEVNGGSLELTDTLTLAEDGKVLSFVRAARTPGGTFVAKTSFNKR